MLVRWFVAFAFLAVSVGLLGGVVAPEGIAVTLAPSPAFWIGGLLVAFAILGAGLAYHAGRVAR